MPIMDLDDTSNQKQEKYISKELFKDHWLYPYIVPIWNKKNLDEVLLDLKMIEKLPSYREKGRVYRNLFLKNKGESDIEQVKKLNEKFKKCKNTNMDIFLQKCLDSVNSF